MLSAPRQKLTYDEYLELERETDLRHEYLDGEVWAMGGGTPRHSKLKSNLLVAIGSLLGDGPCQAYDSDLRVRVPATGLVTYPDVTVVCGPIDRHPEDRQAITNPTAAFEVLSDSTAGWDRGEKFRHLGTIPTLKHYVLVTQDPPFVEVYTRLGEDHWDLVRHRAGVRVPLPGLGIEIEVDRLYRNLPEE